MLRGCSQFINTTHSRKNTYIHTDTLMSHIIYTHTYIRIYTNKTYTHTHKYTLVYTRVGKPPQHDYCFLFLPRSDTAPPIHRLAYSTDAHEFEIIILWWPFVHRALHSDRYIIIIRFVHPSVNPPSWNFGEKNSCRVYTI